MGGVDLQGVHSCCCGPCGGPAKGFDNGFDFQWRYLSLDIPQTLTAGMVEREREKAKADVAAEVDEIRLALRTSFAELVQHAADRLAPVQDGKPKIFRDSLIKNMEEFFHYFQAKNLTEDVELESLVEKARAALNGVTPDVLRDSDNLRLEVQRTMTQIKETMDQNLLLKPSRRFTLAPELAHAEV